MYIKIEIKNMANMTKIIADLDKNKLWVDDKLVKADVDRFASRLFFITSKWEGKYSNPHMLDAEEFDLYITDGKKEQFAHGKGRYPINYADFKQLLNEVAKC